jgi:putative flippase GtrA
MIRRAPNLFRLVFKASLVRFGIVGGANTVTDLVVFFSVLSVFSLAPVAANAISFSAAVSQSYLLNKYWSFVHDGTGKPSWREYGQFVSASLFALGVTSAILFFGDGTLPIWQLKLVAVFVTPFINFLSYKHLIFRPR